MNILLVILIIISLCVIGYFIGGIIFAEIYAKFKNDDIHKFGSGNPGATNIGRTYGKVAAISVALLDASKGYVTTVISLLCFKYLIHDNTKFNFDLTFLIFLPGLFTLIGHCFPIQYFAALVNNNWDFKKAKIRSGGKGVATAGGIYYAISPYPATILLILWVIIVYFTKYVSMASLLVLLIGPFLFLIPVFLNLYMVNNTWFDAKIKDVDLLNFQKHMLNFIGILIINVSMFGIVCFKHRANIKRLIEGTELKVWVSKKNKNLETTATSQPSNS